MANTKLKDCQQRINDLLSVIVEMEKNIDAMIDAINSESPLRLAQSGDIVAASQYEERLYQSMQLHAREENG